MSCLQPEAVEKHCGPNASGLKPRLYAALPSSVDAIPAATDGVVSTDITMLNTDVFVEIAISKYNGEMNAEPEGDVDGTELPVRVSGMVVKMEGGKSASLNKLQGGEYIFIVIDRNGKKWIIGDKEEGGFIQIGLQTNDKNGYPFTIEWDTANMPYEYTGVIPT